MNSDNKNTLYIILNYSLNYNIYKLIDSIKKFCFSFLSLSFQNDFELYLIYNNSYTILFPSKLKDPVYIITGNFAEISNSIDESLKYFFDNVSQAENKLNSKEEKNNPIAINSLLKKILLIINQKNKSKNLISETIFFLSSNSDNEKNDRIILINDSEKDFEEINQKYIFLLKKEKIKIDILSLNENNNNETSKAICLFTNGFFDKTDKDKNNIEQILIQEYIPIKIKELLQNKNNNIKNSINYMKVISDDNLKCSLCHTVIENNEINNNSLNSFPSLSISRNSSEIINNRINNNSPNCSKLYYLNSEKNIFCYNCFKKKYNNL